MPYILKKYYSPRQVFFFLGEGLLIFLSVIAVYIFFRGTETFVDTIFIYWMRALVVTVTFQLSLYFFDLYDLGEIISPPDVVARFLQAFGVGCIVLAIVYYCFPLCMIKNPYLLACICSCLHQCFPLEISLQSYP